VSARPARASAARRSVDRAGRKRPRPETGRGRPRANATIRFLADFCLGHPLDEKVFIVPSFIIGRQIGQALARESGSWANLRFFTLTALAQETAAKELLRLGRRQIPESGQVVLADALFRELKEEGGLEYFGRLQARPGLARALHGAIRTLRLSGLDSASLEAGRFCLESKGHDVIRLLSRYERTLEALRALDVAGLLTAAREVLDREKSPPQAHGRRWVLCPEDSSLSRLEDGFLRAAAGDHLVVVPGGPVVGLERPRGFFGPAGPPAAPDSLGGWGPSSDVERLPWLFAPAGAPPPVGDGSVDMFRAVGQVNECREVIRRILANRWPFDSVEVVVPPSPAYPSAFHLLSVRSGMPITIADGLPLLFTGPGRVFSGLADWVEGGFPVSVLCHLIESGDLVLQGQGGGGDLPNERIGRHLRNAMIGWGRERYLERLDAYRKRLETDLKRPLRGRDELRTPGESEDLQRGLREVEDLREAIGDLLDYVPAAGPAGSVDLAGLASGLAAVLRDHARVRPGSGDRGAEALDLITAELGRIAEEDRALAGAVGRAARPLPLGDALERLRAAVAALGVGASAPLPGHLHVSSFGSGGASGRPVTFIAGLNDTAVPGTGPQDPILLDAEREAISSSLPTTADALKANLHTLAALLASRRGRVVLSYSAYDIMDDRRLYPSSVLLQALRLLRGDPGLDYSDLNRAFRDEAAEAGRLDPAGFIPGGQATAFDERDWWLGRLVPGGSFLDGLGAVKACFPVLADGIAAAEARDGQNLTAYEGLVRIDRARFDPLRNHDLVLSASRLELLAKCPYGYFLRYVLDVEPARDLELDRSRWLDPVERGSLLHRILYEFLSEVTRRGERVSAAGHALLMDGIASAAIREWRQDVPPPSEGIFDKERLDILEALGIFLRVEGARDPAVRPVALEKEFKDVVVEAGRGGWFKLRGFIDRIDRTGPGTYRIIDYKTGSYRDYEDLEAFDRGRRIQHALYALAAEKILAAGSEKAKPRIVESGYFFPTRRGEGREIMVGPFDRGQLRDLLADLLALIAKGYFVTTTEDECGFCDFKPVCGRAFRATKGKLPANPDAAEALARLKRYA